MSPSVDTALRFLQIVGLSLPAVALYLGVLTDVHMTARRETATVPIDEGEGIGVREMSFERERFTVHLTDAPSLPDFLIGLLSLIGLLISGISLGIYLVTQVTAIYYVGIGLLMLAFLLLGVSCTLLAYTSFQLVR